MKFKVKSFFLLSLNYFHFICLPEPVIVRLINFSSSSYFSFTLSNLFLFLFISVTVISLFSFHYFLLLISLSVTLYHVCFVTLSGKKFIVCCVWFFEGLLHSHIHFTHTPIRFGLLFRVQESISHSCFSHLPGYLIELFSVALE